MSCSSALDSFIALCGQGRLKEAFTAHFSILSSDPSLLSHILKACVERRSIPVPIQPPVNAYDKLSRLEIDLNLFEQMPERNVMSYNIIIGGYVQSGELGAAVEVFKGMHLRNSATWNAVITKTAGRIQNGCPTGALDLYYTMKKVGLRPEKITSSLLVRSTLGQGRQIHAEVVKSGVRLLRRCCRTFGERKGVGNDHVLRSLMIAAYGFHGKGHEAIELFKKMDLDGIEENEVTFLSLFYACSHCGLKEEGLEFLHLMVEKHGLGPRAKHYTCIVDLMGRAGRSEEAEGLIRSMPVAPDAITWKTLLSACKVHKDTDMAKRIAEEIMKIDPYDSASYVLLSNTEASAERWHIILQVRREMRERMVREEPGISWFELKKK
ncbi:hypothetical protein OROGR_025397 [Orobanche gracilis]